MVQHRLCCWLQPKATLFYIYEMRKALVLQSFEIQMKVARNETNEL